MLTIIDGFITIIWPKSTQIAMHNICLSEIELDKVSITIRLLQRNTTFINAEYICRLTIGKQQHQMQIDQSTKSKQIDKELTNAPKHPEHTVTTTTPND